jgi:NAD dependent epimerase/dehydratase family enzyme
MNIQSSSSAPTISDDQASLRASRRCLSVLTLGADQPLGARVVRLLEAAGHRVDTGASQHRESGLDAGPRHENTEDPETAPHVDVICDLTPVLEGPTGTLTRLLTTRERRRRQRLRSRQPGVELSERTRWIQRSTVSIYQDGASRWIDEHWPTRDNPRLEECVAAETKTLNRPGNGVVLRLGHLWGHHDPATRALMLAARNGYQLFDGPPRAYWPSLHLDAAASAVVAAIDVPAGVYNIADTSQLTFAEVSHALARAVGRRRLHPLSATLNHSARELFHRSHRIDAYHFRSFTRWSPNTPTLVEGLPDLANPTPFKLYQGWRTEVPW